MNSKFIVPLDSEVVSLATAGGKGANLARLIHAGFPVPSGFIVTTEAYNTFVASNALADFILSTAHQATPDNPNALGYAARTIRARFEEGRVPPIISSELRSAYAALGHLPVAVRSSATAEDLPGMSFAGQHDTFLNVVGNDKLLEAVVKCWSSLWTARAIGYRARNGIPHESVSLAVVVQSMVPSESAGVLFTANPLSEKRTEIVIDATLGLGEALMSGQVEPDHYVVDQKHLSILGKTLGTKAIAIRAEAEGGTVKYTEHAGHLQAIPDEVILELARLGCRVADYMGSPQDIEWAWSGETLHLLQSRPITTLYPLSEELPFEPVQALLFFGMVQGLLDPMTPLGQDTMRGVFAGAAKLFGLLDELETLNLLTVGERLWFNVTPFLRNRIGRIFLQKALSVFEPGTVQAMNSLTADPRMVPTSTMIRLRPRTVLRVAWVAAHIGARLISSLLRPDQNRTRVEQQIEDIVTEYKARGARARTLSDKLTLYEAMLDDSFGVVIPHIVPRVLAGVLPLVMLNKITNNDPQVLELTQGLPHNVIVDLELNLWATSQRIKTDPESTVSFAQDDARTLAAAFRAGQLPPVAQRALTDFFQHYGMRGLAEIDLGRPRWREDPTPILQVLKNYLRTEDPSQAPDKVFAGGVASAEDALQRLITRVRQTPGGWLRIRVLQWGTSRLRALAGLRESPKSMVMQLFDVVRAGLLESGDQLVAAGVLVQPDDIFFLHLSELKALAEGQTGDWQAFVAERRQHYVVEKSRRWVPRILLSDGQALYGGVGATEEMDEVITGSPVSPGMAEGKVQVILDPREAHLEPGDILVCPGTDPSWTPLFLTAGGLVMELGGLMTHGAVLAREFGIPAIVGVYQATKRLVTGTRVQVDGTSGRIEILED